jgi:hypothetical protein
MTIDSPTRQRGAADELFIIRNLPLFLVDAMRVWLQHLLEGCVCCWDDLINIFVGHFKGTYTCPGNPWDLWNCRQKSNETLC